MQEMLFSGLQMVERGWLSANMVIAQGRQTAVVDTGYVRHEAQTLALVRAAFGQSGPQLLINTHLHSDHCGGNQALQAHYLDLQTWIPPGLAQAVQHWSEDALSYKPTGQNCPAFRFDGLLQPGSTHRWGGMDWQVHAAPGHDPHSVILFAPEHRLLMSADALWQNGFGVVFPALEGMDAFDEVAQTLDLIERLNPATIIPGHGAVFTELAPALALARSKLNSFAQNPERHARYGAKVLLKFKLLEWGHISQTDFDQWAAEVPYLQQLHQRYGDGLSLNTWLQMMLAELERSGALTVEHGVLHDA
jgi:glyoxylase-like metal-dependent hydrolase (beta-lactamase superfamily II)